MVLNQRKNKGGERGPVEIWLEYETDVILAYMSKVHAEDMRFRLIYCTVIDGKKHQVVRYDCCHGFPHKDICYTTPNRKEKMPKLPNDKLIEMAMHDLKTNYQAYKQKYLKLTKNENQKNIIPE